MAKENGMPITLLAKRAGYKNRASFYSHITEPHLSYEILFKYGKVLHYNFAEHFAEITNLDVHDPDMDYKKEPLTVEQAMVMIEKLKEQHYNLLVKYEHLLEKFEQLTAGRS